MVQPLGVNAEVSLDLDIGPRAKALFLAREEQRQDAAKGFGCPHLGCTLVASRIAPKLDFGMQESRPLARLVRSKRARRPEIEAPLLGADPVLENPGPAATGTQPQRQPRNSIIEDERIGFAGRQCQCGDVARGLALAYAGEPHGWEVGKHLGNIGKHTRASSCK